MVLGGVVAVEAEPVVDGGLGAPLHPHHRHEEEVVGEGVRLGVKGVAETLREPGPETAAEMVDALVAGGAALLLEALSEMIEVVNMRILVETC